MTDHPTDFWIVYGRSGFLGRFRNPQSLKLARGDFALVRTPRGVEVGVVKNLAQPGVGDHLFAAGGEVLPTPEQPDWHTPIAVDEADLEQANTRLAGLPLTILDAETLYDRTVIFHVIVTGDCDADPVLAELAAEWQRPVQLLDIGLVPYAKEPPARSGCSSGNCGSSGGCSSGNCGSSGGCSTGNCSRGQVKSAEQLTGYFRELREAMEAEKSRYSLYSG